MLTVSQVARKARVAPNTVRNHVRDFPDLFSEAARGLKGNRLFDSADVEAFCSLVALKDSGMPLMEAAERIREREAPTVIDVGATPLQRAASPKEARSEEFLLPATITAMQRQIDAQNAEIKRAIRNQEILIDNAYKKGQERGAIVTLAAGAFALWLLWLLAGIQ